MTLQLYVGCFLTGLLGIILSILVRMRSAQVKAKLSNVEFKSIEVIKEDWVLDACSLVSILMLMFFIESVLKIRPDAISYFKFIFAFTGYTGSDVLSRFFSVVNKKLNAAIDYKTTQADIANGTVDKPTPK